MNSVQVWKQTKLRWNWKKRDYWRRRAQKFYHFFHQLWRYFHFDLNTEVLYHINRDDKLMCQLCDWVVHIVVNIILLKKDNEESFSNEMLQSVLAERDNSNLFGIIIPNSSFDYSACKLISNIFSISFASQIRHGLLRFSVNVCRRAKSFVSPTFGLDHNTHSSSTFGNRELLPVYRSTRPHKDFHCIQHNSLAGPFLVWAWIVRCERSEIL